MPEFIVKLGDKTLQTKALENQLLRIGRSRDNEVVLENLSVSREHAQVRFHDDRYTITDLNSANGTMVNGVKVTKTEIVDGDVITIGKHKLYFQNPPTEQADDGSGSEEQHTVMMEPKAEAWLSIESGRLQGREFRIARFETSLGKAPTNDIVLTDDWLLGKKQAIILRKGNDQYEIQYLGGLRGVKVNGTAITNKAPIKDGDIIEMGATKLAFHSTPGPVNAPRVNRPLSAEPVINHTKAGLLAARKESFPDIPSEDSLDLEDGFQSVRITMNSHLNNPEDPESPEVAEDFPDSPTPPSNLTPPEELQPEAVAPEQEPALVAAADSNHQAVLAAPTPTPATTNNNAQPSPYVQPEARNNGRNRNTVFEDQRSTSRRKRKHHKRANARNTQEPNPEPAVAVKKALSNTATPPHSEVSLEKEIQMWESALQNPSSAIKRQAVKMLKKLTGRDYEF